MENIGGIFVVLICGLIIAVFVAIMEFVWSTRCSSETDEVRPHSCPRRHHRPTPVGPHGNTPTLTPHPLLCSVCVFVGPPLELCVFEYVFVGLLLAPFVCVYVNQCVSSLCVSLLGLLCIVHG